MSFEKRVQRILMVEDNPGDFIIVEDLLLDAFPNIDIVHSTSFRGAVRQLENEPKGFDIILLDLTLPDKTGDELVTEMLQLAGPCPIIILTGSSDIEFSIKSISKGIADYQLKDDLNAGILYKSIIYAIERRKTTTQLEESEKRYSELFQLSPQPMMVYDQGPLLFLAVNKAAVGTYGYSKDEFLKMTLHDVTMPATPAETPGPPSPPEAEVLKAGLRHRKKNGDLIFVEVHVNTVRFNGQAACLLVANDITEGIKHTLAIEEQNKKLLEIAWIQSHVVRAPLAKMMGIISLINELKIASPQCLELLHHLLVAGTELDKIIKDIARKSESINDIRMLGD